MQHITCMGLFQQVIMKLLLLDLHPVWIYRYDWQLGKKTFRSGTWWQQRIFNTCSVRYPSVYNTIRENVKRTIPGQLIKLILRNPRQLKLSWMVSKSNILIISIRRMAFNHNYYYAMFPVWHPSSICGKIHLQLKGLLTISITGDRIFIIQLNLLAKTW